MTVQEAIKNVTTYVLMECENMPQQVIKALDVLRDSANECEQYRALGTVEELKEAREKQVANELNNKEIMELANKIILCLKKQNNSYFTDVVASAISMREEFDEVQFEYWGEEDDSN